MLIPTAHSMQILGHRRRLVCDLVAMGMYPDPTPWSSLYVHQESFKYVSHLSLRRVERRETYVLETWKLCREIIEVDTKYGNNMRDKQ